MKPFYPDQVIEEERNYLLQLSTVCTDWDAVIRSHMIVIPKVVADCSATRGSFRIENEVIFT